MVAFIATNLDDLFLLVAWFAAGRYRPRDIVLGQYAGIGLLFAASLLASLVALALPATWLPWLGLLPLLLGIGLLLQADDSGGRPLPASPASGLAAVTSVTVASGADNIAVYVPLFAVSDARALAIMAIVFAVLLAFWCAAARWLVNHPSAGAPLRRWGPRLTPWVLIALGLWILAGAL